VVKGKRVDVYLEVRKRRVNSVANHPSLVVKERVLF
jgi:hypothetical protein